MDRRMHAAGSRSKRVIDTALRDWFSFAVAEDTGWDLVLVAEGEKAAAVDEV